MSDVVDGSPSKTKFLQTLTLATTARTQLLAAALVWTVMGGALLFVGVRWALAHEAFYIWLLLPVAAAAGLMKTRMVLDRAAIRLIDRIRDRGDGHSLVTFLPLRAYLLIGLMMAGGRFLRSGVLDLWIVGLLYTAIGSALLYGSRVYWAAWSQSGADRAGSSATDEA